VTPYDSRETGDWLAGMVYFPAQFPFLTPDQWRHCTEGINDYIWSTCCPVHMMNIV